MNKKNKNEKTWREWFSQYLYLPIITIIASSAISAYISFKFINPPSLPNIEPTVIYNAGPSTEIGAPFRLDLQIDKTPWLITSIVNNGTNDAEKLEVGFYLLRNHNILKTLKKYNPKFLEKRVRESKQEANSFYEELSSLPSESSIQYTFYFDKFIKSLDDDFQLSICSKSKNWSKSAVIKPRYSKSKTFITTIAYAEDKIKNDNQPEVPKSGILIGGYDPVVMSNELFLLLQAKSLISKDEAAGIKKTVESSKEGVLFGGINILKFNELIINGLFSNRVITIEQANTAIEKSRNAGGVMVGGYNVIVLEVEILNVLLKNKKITLEEGQRVIDHSKSKSN